MPGFVISYVPNVENVDNIELLKKVNGVDEVTKVDDVAVVETVNDVKKVDDVAWVDTVNDVNTVHDVRRLPHPYFPLKLYNYQQGGMVHITATQNAYQAVYIPAYDCEFKGVHLCFTSYNIDDTYDIMIGSRYICRGSHVKEMSEYRMLEVYEDVTANTPIVIQFSNNSGLEKYLMYEFITLADVKNMNTSDHLAWTFDWQDATQQVAEQTTCNLVINQPDYVNMDSKIESFTLEVSDITNSVGIATISCDSTGKVTTTYAESESAYQGLGLLARANAIGIVSVTRFDKTIQIVFKNINNTGTTTPHSIEMRIKGTVNNIVTN